MVRKRTGFCSAVCRDAFLATCDWCRMNDAVCPGPQEHCSRGEHCVFTTEVCAMDRSNDDHPSTCEHCKQPLGAAL
jgi:hypothetical protein